MFSIFFGRFLLGYNILSGFFILLTLKVPISFFDISEIRWDIREFSTISEMCTHFVTNSVWFRFCDELGDSESLATFEIGGDVRRQ